jgi:Asp-tRNA(Asn)/Glu-tRNA(Gln) amidotransferase A subunit family amidase
VIHRLPEGEYPDMSELWSNSATELAALIAAKEVTSREVVDAHRRTASAL